MLLDQVLVMCLLSIGSRGNMSPDSKITRSKGPSDAMSLPRGTHPNAGQGVNQAQTHSGLDSRLQALVLQGPSSIMARNFVDRFLFLLFFVCIKLLGNVCESVP